MRDLVQLTNKVTESGSQLNLGLNERVTVVLKGNEEDLFHFVRQLLDSGQSGGGDGR